MTVLACEPVAVAGKARTGYLPQLDGLRGLSILLVLAFHARVPQLQGGYIGVDIFFVLSGFLITSLLIKEWEKTNRIGLAHFYMRRALRLLPAVVFMLAVYVGVSYFVSSEFRKVVDDALLVLFYGANWARAMGRKMWGLGHTWSLSIEEQFYLLWPLLFIVLMRLRLRRGALACIVAAMALTSAGVRIALWMNGATKDRLYNGLDTHADALLIGCALAFFMATRNKDAALPRWSAIIGIGGASFLLICAVASKYDSPAMFLAGYFLIGIASAGVVFDLLTRENTTLRRATEWPPLVYLGRISYGLYLWHFPIYKLLESIRDERGWSVRWPLYLLVGGPLTLAIAMASYRFLEMPFLRLKRKFQ